MDGWCKFNMQFYVVSQMYGWINSVSFRYRKDGWMTGWISISLK